MTVPLLAIRGVKTFYGNIMALKGIDLDVNDGEIVALIGANGAGKSTLMMTIFGNPRASAGSIAFDGQDITQRPAHEIARLRIAQSPEGRRIFPRMSVLENVAAGALFGGARPSVADAMDVARQQLEFMGLAQFADRCKTVEWTKEALAAMIKEVLAANTLKMPQMAMPLRLIVTGQLQTPAIDAVLQIFGRDAILARLAKFI